MNGSKKKIFLSILLVLIIVVAICFAFVLTHKDNKDNKNEKPSTNQTIKIDNAEEKMMDIIKKYNLMALGYDNKNVKFDKNISQPMMELFYSYIDLSKTYSKEDADKYFKELYNIVPTKYTSYICPVDDEALLIYDEDKKEFRFNDEHPGHGGRIYNYSDYKVISSNNEDDIYEISVVFFYGSEAEGYYINGEELSVDFEDSYEEPEDYEKAYKNYFKNEIKDFKNYYKYTYKFKAANGNLYLISFEKTK